MRNTFLITAVGATVALLILGCENKVADPEIETQIWPAPEGAIKFTLSQNEVEERGQTVSGEVFVENLTSFRDHELLPEIAPLITFLETQDADTALFKGNKVRLEHPVDTSRITSEGTYSFGFQLYGVNPGRIGIIGFFTWDVLTEGGCSVALIAIAAGCAGAPACICTSMAAMAPPGSWSCTAHPKVSRYWWTKNACVGPPPF